MSRKRVEIDQNTESDCVAEVAEAMNTSGPDRVGRLAKTIIPLVRQGLEGDDQIANASLRLAIMNLQLVLQLRQMESFNEHEEPPPWS